MLVLICWIALLIIKVSAGNSTGGSLSSIWCMSSLDIETPCKVLGVPDIPILPRLLEIYANQSSDVQAALDNGNFSTVEEASLKSFSPVLLLIIPNKRLTSLDGSKVSQLILHWQNIPAVAKHLVKSVTISNQYNVFLKKLQNVNISADILDIVAEEATVWYKKDKSILHSISLLRSPLLAKLALGYLDVLEEKNATMLYHLSVWIYTNNPQWSFQTKAVQRLWALSMIKNNFQVPLHQWEDTNMLRMGKLLIGCTPKELLRLNITLIKNKKMLLNFNFTTLQVRALFSHFYGNKELTNEDLEVLKPFLLSLTPTQLLQLPYNMVNYSLLELPSEKSLPAVKQILEFLILQTTRENHKNISLTSFGKCLYAVPPSSIRLYMNSQHNLSELIPIQSEFISPLQAFLLTDSGYLIDPNSHDIYKYRELLHALPTSSIQNASVSDQGLFHFFEHTPGHNIPRSVTLLSIFLDLLDYKEVISLILGNRDVNYFLQLIPSPFIRNNSEKFMESISELHMKSASLKDLPPDMLTNLLAKERGKTWTWELVENTLHPYFLFLSGITCEDISALETSDFIVVLSKYNKELKNLRKVFPKNLQHCCTEKLINYLVLKSTLIQRFNFEDPTSLLTEAEISAVGGYILANLPLHIIKASEHFVQIVQTIGKLSFPELLIAAPKSKLQSMIHLYIKERPINANMLFELGNLTLLAPVNVIRNIEQAAFKLILECQHIDTRLCANAPELGAWSDLIRSSFGNPDSWDGNTLVTLNDMMVAIPYEILNSVNKSALIEAADILATKYNDAVEWAPPVSFYKACTSLLEETNNYLHHLNGYIRLNLYAVQIQLNTISNAKTLSSRKSNFNGEFIDTIAVSDLHLITVTEPYLITEDENIVGHSQYETTEDYSTEDLSVSDVTNIEGDDHQLSETTEFGQSSVSSSSPISSTKVPTTYMGTTLKPSLNLYSSDNYSNSSINQTSYSTETNHASTLDLNHEEIDNHNNTLWNKNMSSLSSEFEKEKKSFNYDTNNPNIMGNDNNQEVSYSTENISAMNNTTHLVYMKTKGIENSTDSLESSSPYSFKEESDTTTHKLLLTSSLNDTNINEMTTVLPNLKSSTATPALAENQTVADTEHTLVSEYPAINSPDNKSPAISDIDENVSDEAEEQLHIIGNIELRAEKNEMVKPVNEVVTEFLKKYTNRTFSTKQPIIKSKRDVSLNKITCEAVKMVGRIAEISLTINDIKHMSSGELFDCMELFGKMDLSTEIMNEIWSRLPKDAIHLMGKLVGVANITDVLQTNFHESHPWALETLSVLGRFNQDKKVKEFIRNQIVQFSYPPLTPETVSAMGPLICALPNVKIPRYVNPATFLKTSVILGIVLPCNIECLSELANIAIHPSAFGSIKQWTPGDVKSLGVTIAGLSLEQWKFLAFSNYKALAGIQYSVVNCLPENFWSEIPEHSLPFLPALITDYLKINMARVFSPKQMAALNKKLLFSTETIHHPNSSGNTVRSSYYLLLATIAIYLFMH